MRGYGDSCSFSTIFETARGVRAYVKDHLFWIEAIWEILSDVEMLEMRKRRCGTRRST